jgi:hypothetical protein
MAKKPEWFIKQAVNITLASYPESYVFRSVPFGYGPSTVDYLVCHYGRFIGIETKAPGEKPTDRQRMILKQINDAGGDAFVIDSIDKAHTLRVYLEQVKRNATSPSQPQAPDGGGAVLGEGVEPFPNRKEYLARWWATRPAAASPDRDVFVKKTGVRRTKPDPDALRLVRGKPVRLTEIDGSDAVSGTKSIRAQRDGDGEDEGGPVGV